MKAYIYSLFIVLQIYGLETRAITISCQQRESLSKEIQLAIGVSLEESSKFHQRIDFKTPPQINNDDKCEINLTDFVKPEDKYLTDKKFSFDGLNCWGSVLYLKKLRNFDIYAHDKEFTNILENKNICRKLEEFEEPQAGDIGTIRKQIKPSSYEEIHAYIYVNSQYAISKHSFSFEAPLEIIDQKNIYADYGGDQSKTLCDRQWSCKAWTDYYRCRDDITRARDYESSLGFTSILMTDKKQEISEIAKRLSYLIKSNKGLATNLSEYNEIYKKIENLNYYFFNATNEKLSRDLYFYLFESIIWQFTYLSDDRRTPLKP